MARMINISTKRLAIDKAQTQIVILVAAASIVTVFSLVACKAILSQTQYYGRVISKQNIANKQLKDNIVAYTTLQQAYSDFESRDPNVIGGSRQGTGENDGTNSEIVLDALPSSYDFPALASSLEKVLVDRQYSITSITGTDDQLAQQANTQSASPQAVPMPFSFTVNSANYQSVRSLVDTLLSSIRPIQIDTMTISGGGDKMQASVTAHTYYQPGVSLQFPKEAVK